MTLMLIAGSAIFGHFLAITEIPFIAADWAAALPIPKAGIMLVIIVLYLLGGSIMDDLAFMVLATPIFFAMALKLGYDPIWFGIMICITLMIGGLIPPIVISICLYCCPADHVHSAGDRDMAARLLNRETVKKFYVLSCSK